MGDLDEYIAIMNRLQKVYRYIPDKAAVVAVNFFKERFRLSRWEDTRTENWKPRKATKRLRDRGRAILVKSGKLKRDIHKVYANENAALISTSTITKAYAKIHNEGGTVNTTATVGEHSRKAHKRQRKGRTEKVKEHTVKEHTRRVKFRMPKRQYMGTSAVLDKRLERMISSEIIKGVKG